MVLSKILYNKVEIPDIGFGTHNISNDNVKDVVYNAIKSGYRHIDTAQVYQNEEGIGRAIKRSINEKVVNREDLFITTKTPWMSPGYKETLDAFNESLEKLGVSYIDLYLIHHPFGNFFNQPYFLAQTAKAVKELYAQGKIRAWGVSNFSIDDLIWVVKETNMQPMVNQIEFNPEFKQKELYNYCQKNNITIIAWGVLKQGKIIEGLDLLEKKYKKSASQISIQYVLQKGCAVLVRSSNPKHMVENLQSNLFQLSEEDINTIDGLKDYSYSWYREDRYKLIGTMEREKFFQRISESSDYKKIYKLFGVFPILKEKKNKDKIRFYLFGFIPFLKITKQENKNV